jgi:hypothetical protein
MKLKGVANTYLVVELDGDTYEVAVLLDDSLYSCFSSILLAASSQVYHYLTAALQPCVLYDYTHSNSNITMSGLVKLRQVQQQPIDEGMNAQGRASSTTLSRLRWTL